VESGDQYKAFHFEQCVEVSANSSTDIASKVPLSVELAESCVLALTLTDDRSGKLLARAHDWPQPFKYLHFPKREVSVHVDASASLVKVSASKPVKGLMLSCQADIDFSDNCIDIVPGQVYEVELGRYSGESIEARWYGDEEE
jgi:beta-mannosidase